MPKQTDIPKDTAACGEPMLMKIFLAGLRPVENPWQIWWIDLGWMPDAHQATLLVSLLNWTGQRKYNKRLMSLDEDREITHHYQPLSSCSQ